MKKHPIELNLPPFISFIWSGNYFEIPSNVASKYVVSKVRTKNLIAQPVELLFSDLIKKRGKAGSLLTGVRHRENLSQTAFAKRIGVTQSNLSKMENGIRPIGKIIAKRIEAVFGTNYRYFLE